MGHTDCSIVCSRTHCLTLVTAPGDQKVDLRFLDADNSENRNRRNAGDLAENELPQCL